MIGVFDSGVGGLSVLRHLVRLLPDAGVLYVGDRARAPYGTRSLADVRWISEQIVDHLRAEGASMVVVACNTASAAALHHLRRTHPGLPFVGMEPAVKPAASATGTGTIGVLATPATFQGELFASLVDRFAAHLTVVTRPCEGWVELVERGVVDGPEAEREVARHVLPVLEAGADTLVLGCTHYPFLAETIRRVAGPGVTVIDPAPAVARQAARVAAGLGIGDGDTRIRLTGDVEAGGRLVAELTELELPVEAVTFEPSERTT